MSKEREDGLQGAGHIINIITMYRLNYNFVINLSPYLLSATEQIMAGDLNQRTRPAKRLTNACRVLRKLPEMKGPLTGTNK